MVTKTTRSAASGDTDAIALLKTDHKKVKGLFKEFAAARKQGDGDEVKAELVAQICRELRVHTELEEAIFYPAVRERIDDVDLMDEALVEHAGARDLVAQLEGMSPDEDLYDAKVTVLREQIDQHVEEEEGVMFPKAKRAKVDTTALGARMMERKAAIQETLGEGDGRRAAWRSGPRRIFKGPAQAEIVVGRYRGRDGAASSRPIMKSTPI